MATVTETLQVSGVRCERCVNRLAVALRSQEGLEAANANLMGQVLLSGTTTSRAARHSSDAMSRAGFREVTAV